MDGKTINVLVIILVAFVCLSDLMALEDATGFSLTGPGNYSCVSKLQNGNYTFATNCTNGRGLTGCCIDRVHCNYNTTNIDLTMYAPPGFKGSCAITYECCPFQFVVPITLTNTTKEDNVLDKDDLDNDDLDTDAV